MSTNEPHIPRAAAADTLLEASALERDALDPGRWPEDAEELPRRPRRRLLTPLTVALAMALTAAGGFLAGVLIEKGQGPTTGASGAGGGLASRLAALGRARAPGSEASGGARGAGAGQAAAGAGATAGQVAFIHGGTLYVTTLEGNTIKVTTSPASTVTRSVTGHVADIHPGETVLVTGTPGSGGSISAESIRVGEGFGGGLAALLGRSGPGGGRSAGAQGGRGEREPALFGSG
jgi:hypothetical protein